jgi:hypothetical protein
MINWFKTRFGSLPEPLTPEEESERQHCIDASKQQVSFELVLHFPNL